MSLAERPRVNLAGEHDDSAGRDEGHADGPYHDPPWRGARLPARARIRQQHHPPPCPARKTSAVPTAATPKSRAYEASCSGVIFAIGHSACFHCGRCPLDRACGSLLLIRIVVRSGTGLAYLVRGWRYSPPSRPRSALV